MFITSKGPVGFPDMKWRKQILIYSNPLISISSLKWLQIIRPFYLLTTLNHIQSNALSQGGVHSMKHNETVEVV